MNRNGELEWINRTGDAARVVADGSKKAWRAKTRLRSMGTVGGMDDIAKGLPRHLVPLYERYAAELAKPRNVRDLSEHKKLPAYIRERLHNYHIGDRAKSAMPDDPHAMWSSSANAPVGTRGHIIHTGVQHAETFRMIRTGGRSPGEATMTNAERKSLINEYPGIRETLKEQRNRREFAADAMRRRKRDEALARRASTRNQGSAAPPGSGEGGRSGGPSPWLIAPAAALVGAGAYAAERERRSLGRRSEERQRMDVYQEHGVRKSLEGKTPGLDYKVGTEHTLRRDPLGIRQFKSAGRADKANQAALVSHQKILRATAGATREQLDHEYPRYLNVKELNRKMMRMGVKRGAKTGIAITAAAGGAAYLANRRRVRKSVPLIHDPLAVSRRRAVIRGVPMVLAGGALGGAAVQGASSPLVRRRMRRRDAQV